MGMLRAEKGTSSSTHWPELDSIFVTGVVECLQASTQRSVIDKSPIWDPGSILTDVDISGRRDYPRRQSVRVLGFLLARERAYRNGQAGRRQRKDEHSCWKVFPVRPPHTLDKNDL